MLCPTSSHPNHLGMGLADVTHIGAALRLTTIKINHSLYVSLPIVLHCRRTQDIIRICIALSIASLFSEFLASLALNLTT